MKAIGIISDAHGNPFGLQACIDKLRKKGIKKIYFLGDAVGYLPLAGEVLEILKQEDVSSIMGNHDAMLCGQIEIELDKSDIYGFKHLPERTVDSVSQELSAWQKRRELNIDGRKLLFVHGSPWKELSEYVYPDSDIHRFTGLEYDAVFMGHTHFPFRKKIDNMLIANAGSCGLPRDVGNMACCLVYNLDKNEIEIIRVPFDINIVIDESKYVYEPAKEVVDCLHRRGLHFRDVR